MMDQFMITDQTLKRFTAFLRDKEKSPLTVEKYLRDLKRFRSFLGKQGVCRQRVLAYKKELEQNYPPVSSNSMIASLNALFKSVNRSDLCLKQFKIQRRVFREEKKELSKEEYLRLVRTAKAGRNERICMILQTICATGIRVSELRFITAEAVRAGETTVSAKNKSRTIFFVRDLQKKLLAYCRKAGISSGEIFVTRRGKSISRVTVWKEMKNLCKEAKVEPGKVFPHNLRHLFARIFYAVEKDLAKLADLLGHSNINTTRIYILTTAFEHRRQMERMHLTL